MAIYERTYRGYAGLLTPAWSRFLVLPRYAYQQVFSSKLFIVFLVLCFILPPYSPLACAVMIYAPHNLNILKLFNFDPANLIRIVQEFVFPLRFMYQQGFMSFLLVFFVGPALISADMRNNGLALYLSRPFTRKEYVLGKLSVLAILLSFITWIPGLLLFFLQSYLMGWQWFIDNLRTGAAIFLGAWIWILVLSLLSLAVSAYVKWKPVARITLVGLYFISMAFGTVINALLRTDLGSMLDIRAMMLVICRKMLGVRVDFPPGLAWLSLLTVCAVCLLLLARKVKAYEVVR